MASEESRLRNIERIKERYRSDPVYRQNVIDAAKRRAKEKKDLINSKMREVHKRRKLKALRRYGDACVCCGERHYQFLTFHHSLNDGKYHRKSLLGDASKSGRGFLIALEREDWPDVPGLETLCANCHMAIHTNGGCPHKQ